MSCKKDRIKVKNKLLQYVNMDFIHEYDSNYLQLVI